jgi:hypothetical protein
VVYRRGLPEAAPKDALENVVVESDRAKKQHQREPRVLPVAVQKAELRIAKRSKITRFVSASPRAMHRPFLGLENRGIGAD